jgi:lipid-A-disaccharide synthase-like uncharacterized protein
LHSYGKIEAVQQRAARFTLGDYRRTSSVSSMLHQLKWDNLITRRHQSKVTMIYRVIHQLVAIPSKERNFRTLSLFISEMKLKYLCIWEDIFVILLNVSLWVKEIRNITINVRQQQKQSTKYDYDVMYLGLI